MLIHPSSLYKIMTAPRTKGEALSEGAKTYIHELAKQAVYEYKTELDIKQIHKGIRCENESIELYNDVFFTNYVKNEFRFENNYLTGEPDIITDNQVIDIKTSWSLETFPATAEQADKAVYEWQGRGYMMLTGADTFVLSYCLVNTPDDLIGFDDPRLHIFDRIPKHLRITRKIYRRDLEKEELIAEKCKAAIDYFNVVKQQILNEHEA